MSKDYRNTKYCPTLTDIIDKKNQVKNAVLKDYPKAKDMHKYISRNYEPYKQLFVDAYNGKCAYCGVSIEIIPWSMFEIDHLIPKTADRFENSKAKAGYIENIVLSCYECNREKSDLEFKDEDLCKVNPDGSEITEAFVRDENYYIRVGEKMKNDDAVNLFYNQVDLGNQSHRLDYLLMNMRGLCEKITDNHPAYGKLMGAVDLLQRKRNLMR